MPLIEHDTKVVKIKFVLRESERGSVDENAVPFDAKSFCPENIATSAQEKFYCVCSTVFVFCIHQTTDVDKSRSRPRNFRKAGRTSLRNDIEFYDFGVIPI